METKELLQEIYSNLNIPTLLSELNPKDKGDYFRIKCPNCLKNEAFIYKKNPFITCNRQNKCGFTSSLWEYIRNTYNLSKKETLHFLAENANISLQNNYKNVSNYYSKPIKPTINIQEEYNLQIPDTIDIVNNNTQIKNFNNIDEIDKFLALSTFIYNFSLNTNQSLKINYYKSRNIDFIPNDIGFLGPEDLRYLKSILLSIFPNNYPPLQNILKLTSSYTIIPSFDLFSNQISALRFRNIYPSKIKELEFSNKRIANPLPYPLTKEKLIKFNTFFITEGHIDGLSLGISNFIAIPGVNSFDKSHFTLFKNKKILICFDNDKAGQESAIKLSDKFNQKNIKNKILKWDIKYGKDINEIKQNYNPINILL